MNKINCHSCFREVEVSNMGGGWVGMCCGKIIYNSSWPPSQSDATALKVGYPMSILIVRDNALSVNFLNHRLKRFNKMSKVLRDVHNNCGEKPQIGKVFNAPGTDSHAVVFTVVNHSSGNKSVAGLVIAAMSGPKRRDLLKTS